MDKKIEIEEIKKGELIAETHKGATQIHRAYYKGKEYALKSVLRDSIETHLELEHLMNERNALRELSHKCINKLIDTIKDDTHLHFLLEIVYGIPLHKLLQMHQKLTLNYAKLIICQIVLILQYMHEQGYVYRDLKASNIMIESTGKVTIIDLGYIKKIGKNRTNSFCGTIHMLAPELFDINLEEQGYSYEVDIYAIGILLYELIVGKAPFGYSDDEQVKQGILLGITQKQLSCLEDENLKKLIAKMLENNPDERIKIENILKDEFFKDINMNLIKEIMENGKLNDSQNNKIFDIEIYSEDIIDFGLQLQKEDNNQEENEKFNQFF